MQSLTEDVRVVLLVPYRGATKARQQHHAMFCRAMRKCLPALAARHPGVTLSCIIVEQNPADGRRFNRGKLLNVGAKYALQEDVDPAAVTLVLHDVDLLPNAALLEAYVTQPPTRTTAVHYASVWRRYTYEGFCGGILGVRGDALLACNGFPNAAWGYGGEDDVLSRRLAAAGVELRPMPAGAEDLHVLDLETLTQDVRCSQQKRLHCPWRKELLHIVQGCCSGFAR